MSLQKYPAPPIIDSVIELRFAKPLDRHVFERIARNLAAHYPNQDIGEEADVEVVLGSGGVTQHVSNERPVHTLTSDDQASRVRFDPFKIFWSRLPPYEGWEELEGRVFSDLAVFPKKVGLPALSRIGVRFRNRIDVPFEADGLATYEDYIAVNIKLPALLAPNDGYAWKVMKQFHDRPLTATVASGRMEPEVPNTAAILLDIDVFGQVELPSTAEELRSALQMMRDLKNDIFEICVTDKARESFK